MSDIASCNAARNAPINPLRDAFALTSHVILHLKYARIELIFTYRGYCVLCKCPRCLIHRYLYWIIMSVKIGIFLCLDFDGFQFINSGITMSFWLTYTQRYRLRVIVYIVHLTILRVVWKFQHRVVKDFCQLSHLKFHIRVTNRTRILLRNWKYRPKLEVRVILCL